MLYTIPQAAALGAVQGLTEFLPVSSSAHLVIVPWLFGWPFPEEKQAFDVALHFGTLFAVLIYFFFDWLQICASYIGDLRQKRWLGGTTGGLLPKVILGTIPGAVAGKLLEKPLEDFFYHDLSHIWMVAVSLSVFGLLLLISERVGSQSRDVKHITYRDALIIGSAQALAILPGVSRSGVTILAALLLGLARPAAARFSFLMATPIIAGAALLKIKEIKPADFDLSLLTGVLMSAIVGILAIRFLLKYVQTRRYAIFVYYRWFIAVVVLAVFILRQRGML